MVARVRQQIVMIILLALLMVGSAVAGDLRRTTFDVQSITCLSCLGRIEAELKKVPGIVGMSADIESGTIVADHEAVLLPENIGEAIGRAGYEAHLLESSEVGRGQALYFSNTAAGRCRTGDCSSQGCGASGTAWKELFKKFMR